MSPRKKTWEWTEGLRCGRCGSTPLITWYSRNKVLCVNCAPVNELPAVVVLYSPEITEIRPLYVCTVRHD